MDRLLRGFADRGHSVALVCGGPVTSRDFEVVKAGGTYSQYVGAPVVCMSRFRKSDVLIDVENGLPFFSPLWRRRPSICLVHHVHSDQWHGYFPAPIARACQLIERRVMPAVYRNRMFVAVSDSTARDLRSIGVPQENIRTIEPGVDAPPFTLAVRSKEPMFLCLSRIVPHKRIDVLLSAWEIASKEIPGRLMVVGDGPGLEDVRRMASTIPRVDVVGRVSEETKYRLLAEAWGVVTAAHHEGWGLSIMEAATVGTPALAVDAPGIRDAIRDGETGILVHAPEGELPTALANAWVALASDHERRDRLGAAARERSTQFSWDRTIDRWTRVLEEVVDQRAPRVITTMTDVLSGAVADRAPTNSPPLEADVRTVGRAQFIDGLRRSIGLLKGFRSQYDDPDRFYTLLADDTVALVEGYQPVSGRRVVDVGGGPGYFAQSFRRAGAESVFVEPSREAMSASGRSLGYGVIGDGLTLPFADGAFDVSHSSNVIEHVPDPEAFFDEMLRIIRPGGLMFLAFTNWLSPFGGHETSPWHYIGGERAAARYERKFGHPPKNRFGSSLFRLDIANVLTWARHRRDADLIDTFPRYYPSWTKPLLAVPGVREIVTWNLVIVMRRH